MELDTLLMTPGPVALDSDVQRAGGMPLRHHRTNDFAPLYAECVTLLKKFLYTSQHLFLSTSSGTGGMEMAIANLFHSGEKIITVETGSFGERFSTIARAYRLNVVPLSYPWGHRAKLEDIERLLAEHPDAKGITVTFNETSTGVMNDIAAIGDFLKDRDILFITDGVSGIGALPFRMDDWHVDCAVTASQKGFLAPPGVGVVAFSERAMKKAMAVECHGLYFNVKEYKRNQDLAIPSYPWTPAISVMFSMHESLKKIERVGLENQIAHFHRLAEGLRAALSHMDLTIFTQPDARSDVLTVINSPQGIHPSAIVKEIRHRYGILIAGGQDKIKDQVFRITTIGAIGERELLGTVGALEMTLHRMGRLPQLGKGMTAMMKVFAELAGPLSVG